MTDPAKAHHDLAVIGGGIFGLSIAYRALKQGYSVILFESDKIGAGSSGGLLGALMPHMPARWNPKKEFQFQALSSLSGFTERLSEETGVATGYRRCARILPITTQDKFDHHKERAEEALERWHPEKTGFTYQVEPAGSRSDWLDTASAPFGIVYETLAARVAPRAYLKALASYISTHGTLIEGRAFERYDEARCEVHFQNGADSIHADRLVLTTGAHAFRHLETLTGDMIGRGEKGQALLMEGSGLADKPAIYCDGLYVVPHDDGTVAIGSTSDRFFDDELVNPDRSRELVERATAFCPSLKGRNVLEEWAGIRPRCNKRDALVGAVPGTRQTYVATGGFKISFGIAHLIADALVAELSGTSPEVVLPPSYQTAHHFG